MGVVPKKYPDLTPEQIAQISEDISTGVHINRALRASGVSDAAYRYYVSLAADGSALYEDWLKSLDEASAIAEAALVSDIKANRDWKAKAFILERRFSKQWGAKIQVDLNNELNRILDVAQQVLPSEQFEKLLAALCADGANSLTAASELEESGDTVH